ncbi:MAG: hypothetical protein ACRCX7_11570 [Cetobacterium sp.]|uniref:hypothetical protein n=1 Tax=Cetobacterium sp. TaxID=2071632 RepID=UPI003F2BCA4D
MNLMTKKIQDPEVPLTNEKHEKFCSEYVRLDIEERIANKKMRRIEAYRLTFPETTLGMNDSVCNSRASVILAKDSVKERIGAIYDEVGNSVETAYGWTTAKSEDLLVSIAYDDSQKAGDRIKAIGELNKMRGIDVPKVEDEEVKGDSVDGFFEKLKGMIDG